MNNDRRELLKKLAYVAPAVIITLKATPTFAGKGSGKTNYKQRWGNSIQKAKPEDYRRARWSFKSDE